MSRAVDALLPPVLGRDFRWLFSSYTASNLADGILLTAGPLLVASLTREPFAVAMAVFLQRIPWVLLGLVAGAIVDRADRRRLIIAVDALRALVLGLLAVAIVTDVHTLLLVYVAMFLVGVAETFADNAGNAMVALTVPPLGLGQANSRLMGANVVTNQLAGPPLGGLLFGIGAALPFGVNAVAFVLAVALVSRIRISGDDEPDEAVAAPATRRSIRAEAAEGARWLWAHPAVRMLTILPTAFNITFGAAFAILVLYAQERLGLGDVGFGVLMAAMALGGIIGSAAYPWLEEHVGYANLFRIGLTIETLTHLALVLTREPLVAGVVLTLFGVHAVVWGSTSNTIRHRAVPHDLLGRVTSVYLLGGVGSLAVGSFLGGVIAQRWGVRAPLWFAFAGAAVTTVLVWRSIDDVAAAGEEPQRSSRA